MKKFAVSITQVDYACKRSLTMAQLEVCFLTCANSTIDKGIKYLIRQNGNR